jgi:hypothetical protein
VTIWNKILHEISNDIEVRVVNFACSKNVIVKSTTFPWEGNIKMDIKAMGCVTGFIWLRIESYGGLDSSGSG